jgi:hypothetical protein
MLRTLDSVAAVAEKSEATTRFKGVLSEVQKEYHVLHSLRLWSWTPSPSMFDFGWRNLPAISPFTALPSPRQAQVTEGKPHPGKLLNPRKSDAIISSKAISLV